MIKKALAPAILLLPFSFPSFSQGSSPKRDFVEGRSDQYHTVPCMSSMGKLYFLKRGIVCPFPQVVPGEFNYNW